MNIKTFSQSIKNIFTLSLLSTTILLWEGCGEATKQPNVAAITTTQLTSNVWKINSVMVDGTDQTNLFANMTLSFTTSNYATTKGGSVWPASGTWAFTDNAAKTIKRNDNIEIAITEISDTTLKLSLLWTQRTLGPGRAYSVAGKHVFSFIK